METSCRIATLLEISGTFFQMSVTKTKLPKRQFSNAARQYPPPNNTMKSLEQIIYERCLHSAFFSFCFHTVLSSLQTQVCTRSSLSKMA